MLVEPGRYAEAKKRKASALLKRPIQSAPPSAVRL
jgi:hypothetical protein